MKKILIVLLSILLLCGCSKDSISWDDVKGQYASIDSKVNEETQNTIALTPEDYKKLVNQISDGVNQSKYKQNDDNHNLLINIYTAAKYLNNYASLFEGNFPRQLVILASNVFKLRDNFYSGNKNDFETVKDDILAQLKQISVWTDDNWQTLEKKAEITWKEVEDAIKKIEKSFNSDLTPFDQITEFELEDYKHVIINNYEKIKDGVNDDEKDVALQMYESALKLKEYTKKIKNTQAKKVKQFAEQTIIYIKNSLHKQLEESEISDIDFSDEIAAAKRWTQSTWNEITRELRLLIVSTNN